MHIRNRRQVLGGVALTATLALAACSSTTSSAGSTSTGTGTTPSGASTTPAASPQVAAAQQIITAAERQPASTFTPPGPAFDASKAKGKMVYYVVPAVSVQVFQQLKTLLADIFAKDGVSMQFCGTDASSPAGLTTCLDQAITAHANAVVTVSVPYQLAPTAFDQVRAAGIPVVYEGEPPNSGTPGTGKQIAFFTPDYLKMQEWNADWIIAKSNGAGHALVVEEDENPGVQAWTEDGTLPEYQRYGPNVAVTKLLGSIGQLDKLTSDVTSKVVANPSLTYFQSPSGNHLQAIVKGLQAAGLSPKSVKVTTMDADLSTMQWLSQGQWMGSVSGYSLNDAAWYTVDQALRLLTGNPAVENEQFPYLRLFTSNNIGSVTLTQAAYNSGIWYGPTDAITQGFLRLWGLS
jgi:ribose transport system substrate-binding protein